MLKKGPYKECGTAVPPKIDLGWNNLARRKPLNIML
jgi:hypothetical protein